MHAVLLLRMVRALPCSPQLLSSSTGHNGEHIYRKLRPRPRVAPFAFIFRKQRHPICFQAHVLLQTNFVLSLCCAPAAPICWLVSYIVSQSLERVGDAITHYTSRHLMSATAARTHIWTGTSTVPPNQNNQPAQTSANAARLNVYL